MNDDLKKAIEKEYRWEYRRRAIGIQPFNFKKLVKVAPALAIGLSTWAVPVILAATSAPAWVIPCALIGGKLISLTYGSVIISKEFKEAKEQLHKDIDSGLLVARYKQDVLEHSVDYTPASSPNVPERGTGSGPFNAAAPRADNDDRPERPRRPSPPHIPPPTAA